MLMTLSYGNAHFLMPNFWSWMIFYFAFVFDYKSAVSKAQLKPMLPVLLKVPDLFFKAN